MSHRLTIWTVDGIGYDITIDGVEDTVEAIEVVYRELREGNPAVYVVDGGRVVGIPVRHVTSIASR